MSLTRAGPFEPLVPLGPHRYACRHGQSQKPSPFCDLASRALAGHGSCAWCRGFCVLHRCGGDRWSLLFVGQTQRLKGSSQETQAKRSDLLVGALAYAFGEIGSLSWMTCRRHEWSEWATRRKCSYGVRCPEKVIQRQLNSCGAAFPKTSLRRAGRVARWNNPAPALPLGEVRPYPRSTLVFR